MKPKTEKKLIKRKLLKPKHHIDTSILLESFREDKLGLICKNYLNLLCYKYRGHFSLFVLGELLLIASEEKKDTEKWKFFNWFFEFVKYKKIDYYSLKNLSLPSELTKMNPRVKGMDALILACAIEDNATLITLDRDLLKAEGIKNKYKVKILTPEEIIS